LRNVHKRRDYQRELKHANAALILSVWTTLQRR
jgi:hypothetical protein